jgi:hypothetical protein
VSVCSSIVQVLQVSADGLCCASCVTTTGILTVPLLLDAAEGGFSGRSWVDGGIRELHDHRALVEADDLQHDIDTDDGALERHRLSRV